jgi:hypothetical protein
LRDDKSQFDATDLLVVIGRFSKRIGPTLGMSAETTGRNNPRPAL